MAKFRCELEFEAPQAIEPATIMKHIWQALDNHQLRSGLKFDELAIKWLGAYNYKALAGGGDAPGGD